MKKILAFSLLMLSFIKLEAQERFLMDSLFYYNSDGSKNWWYVQKDVAAFRLSNGVSLGNFNHLTPSIISSVEHNANHYRSQVLIKFNSGSEIDDRINEVTYIKELKNIEFESWVITKNYHTRNNFHAKEYVVTNDIILINFVDGVLSASTLNSFMEANHITLYHAPSDELDSTNWTYGFKIKPYWYTSIEAARDIFESNSNLLNFCVPDQSLFNQDGISDEFEEVLEVNQYATSGTIKVYPVPAENELNFEFDRMTSATIIITDLNGKKVSETNVDAVKSTIDISKMSSGVFLYSIIENNNLIQLNKFSISK